MRHWYGYTGEYLVLGAGRAVLQAVPRGAAWLRLLDEAEALYGRHPAALADKACFAAALLAPMAVQELGTSPRATAFSSARQLLRLFDGVHAERAAVNLFNGSKASAYAAEGDHDGMAARVARGFMQGELLCLPRDAARLDTQEVLDTLPGALVFLLTRAREEHKAFAGYLRRGAPPVVPRATATEIGRVRPTRRTWEREARLVRREGGQP